MTPRIDFDALFENDLDACALADTSRTVLRVNHAFSDLFGYSPEEAVGRWLDELIVPDHLRDEASGMRARTTATRGMRQDTVRQHKDGKQIPVAVVAQELDVADGQPIVYVQYRDITDQKRAAESLRAGEAQWRAVIQNAPLGIIVANTTGIVLETNEAFARMVGYPIHELRGVNVSSFSHPDEIDRNATYRYELLAGRRDSYRIEKRYRKKDGSWVWGGLTVALIRAADGSPSHLVGVIEDITERLGAAQRREAALTLFTSLIDNMRDGVLVVTSEHRIAALNQSFMTIFGLQGKPADLIGVSCKDAAAVAAALTDNAVAFLAATDQLSAIGKPAREQVKFTDGRTLERDFAPIRDAHSRITGHLWVYHDLTDVLKLQEQLRQSLKMEAIGRLAGGVAHDFNNLLTVLQGHAALLLDEPLPTHVTDDVHEIIKAADRAAGLTRQLLAFSRQQMLQPVTLDLNEVVRDLEKSMLRMVREDIRLHTSLDPDIPLVLADRTQVEQVLLNLAVNARDAMPKGGRLDVKTKALVLKEPLLTRELWIPPGTYAVLEVSDNGEGIDRTILPRIFDPFFTTKEQGKGTGLGLATVYGIVKQSGGYITVESNRGQGAHFCIFLPQANHQ